MFALIGIVVVFGSIIGGYLMEHGILMVLVQPAELVIIGGAAVGTLLVANPLPILIKLGQGIMGVLGGSPYTKAYYLENIKLFNELFQLARRQGNAQIEPHVEEPAKSSIFGKYPNIQKDHHAVNFICDTLRMFVSAGIAAHELDEMMELDSEVHHHEAEQPIAALTTMADALPGLGIVAAVLGVVITMGAIGGPPEEMGHKVAAALVGTFLGILLCYGVFAPIASNMTKINEAEGSYYHFLRVALTAFTRGAAPVMVAEFARRSIPTSVRPSFQEVEAVCRGGSAPAPPK